MGLHISSEHVLKSMIIRNAGKMRWITDAYRSDRCAIISELAGEFFCEMHGIAHTSAVTTADQFPSFLQRGDHERTGIVDRRDVLRVTQEKLQNCGSFCEMAADPVVAHGTAKMRTIAIPLLAYFNFSMPSKPHSKKALNSGTENGSSPVPVG